jgi:methyl-accepting chemotaxis protein
MELRRELFWTISILIALNLALAFGAIGLFVRMGPAIERILQDNVYSMVAAEEVLTEIAASNGEPLSPDARERVRESLEKAKRNVTEAAERPTLAALEERLPEAARGDARARREFVEQARTLGRVNRDAMRAEDEEARRLGTAGAWTAVLLGFASFLLGLFVVTRLQNRLVRPLVELHEVLEKAREGDRLRRCRHPDAPREVVQVTEAVNRLLDERLGRSERGEAETSP